MLMKLLATAGTGLIGLALAAFYPPPPPFDDAPPPPKAKGKEKGKEKAKAKRPPGGPAEDLRKAYTAIRRLRGADRPAGRPEARLRDWTSRAERLYRRGIEAHERGEGRLAHEYGASAHDLAKAVEHARNAALFDEPDDGLPPPPADLGPEGDASPDVRRELRDAYRRISEFGRDGGAGGPDTAFYQDAAVDLYNAALDDARAARNERAGELARAANAMTRVVEHLGHAAEQTGGFGPGDRPEPKARREFPPPRDRYRGDDLPPPIRRPR